MNLRGSERAPANIPVRDAGHGSVIQRVCPFDDPHWDERIGALNAASFFHGTAWARVLQTTYGFSPHYFVAGPRENLRAVLPVMEVNSWVTGRRGISLPFTDECNALCEDQDTFDCLSREILAYAKSRQWKYWELRGSKSFSHAAQASVSYFGHQIDLHGDPMALFAKLHGSTRTSVRKAEQNGVKVEFYRSLEAVRTFHKLLCQTRRRQGMPPQPLRFFENIQRHILARDQGCVVLARFGRIPVAGAMFFEFGKIALYKFGASLDAFQHLRANNLVMWRAIDSYARRGFARLDLGRTSATNEGLRRFKLGWGARENIIEYTKYNCRLGKYVADTDQATGWHNHIFKLLPTVLSRLIGAAAYRHIA